MEKYFREVLHILKNYGSYKKGLDDDYQKAQSSGNYNARYLNDLKKSNEQKLEKYNETTERRLAQIRSEYEHELNIRDNLSGLSLSDHLVRLLNSPIKLNERDFQKLAERNKDNLTASRALHDAALDRGYVLENYIPVDTALEKMDILIDRAKKSMWDFDAIPYYTTADEAATDAGALYAQATKRTFECYRQPKNLEEMISRDAQKVLAERDNVSTEQGAAFLEGFGAPVKDDDGNILTESEQLDAAIHSLFNGRGGQISQADINYIRSDSDYMELREKNPINDSDLSRMRDAVSSAIHERAAALSRGQDVDAANACALDAYTAVMSV